MKLSIASITIGKRIRKNYGDINALADSMNRHGQIQPIVVDNENNLVAGGRRLEAAKQLGWSEIDVVQRDSLDTVARRELELEENIRRKEFDWPEEVMGLAHLFKLRQERFGTRRAGRPSLAGESAGYSVRDASEELDMSVGSVAMDIELAEGLREYPQLIDEKSKTAAFRRLKLLKERAIRTELAARTRSPAVASADDEPSENGEAPSAKPSTPQVPTGIRKAGFKGHGLVYYGDSQIVLKGLADTSIDLVVTDPPFGLGMHTEGASTSDRRLSDAAGGMSDDDPHKVLDMLDVVSGELARVLKPEGHLYMFFHMRMYEDVLNILERHFGDNLDPVPVLWIKNTPGIGNPNQTWVYAYEPCFWVNRGRSLVKAQAFNYISAPTVPKGQRIHPTEKPTALLRHLISASAVAGELVLDPFAGSGSTLVAAVQHGCKFIGVEAWEEMYTRVVNRMAETIGELQAVKPAADAEVQT